MAFTIEKTDTRRQENKKRRMFKKIMPETLAIDNGIYGQHILCFVTHQDMWIMIDPYNESKKNNRRYGGDIIEFIHHGAAYVKNKHLSGITELRATNYSFYIGSNFS